MLTLHITMWQRYKKRREKENRLFRNPPIWVISLRFLCEKKSRLLLDVVINNKHNPPDFQPSFFIASCTFRFMPAHKNKSKLLQLFWWFFPTHMGTVIFLRMYTSSKVFSFEFLTWKKKWDLHLHLHEQGRILPEFFKREMSVLVLKNYWLTIIDFRSFFLNEKCYDRISQIKFNSHFTTKRVFLIDVCKSIWILISCQELLLPFFIIQSQPVIYRLK